MSKRIKYVLAGCVLLLVLILAVPWLVPTSAWLGPLQDQASKSLGAKVVIGDLRLALAPLPHLTASKIDVGEGAIKVESAAVYPALTTLFSAVKTLSSIEVDHLAVSPKGVAMVAALAGKPGGGGGPAPVEIGRLRLKDAQVELASGKLPPVDLDIALSGMSLVSAVISVDGGKAKLKVEPQGDGWDIAMNASNWQLPAGAPLKFDSLTVSGHATKTGVSLPAIAAKLYGGELKAKGDLSWDKLWHLAGHADISRLEIAPVLQALKVKAALSGRLDAGGPFSAQAAKPAALADAINADFVFNVKDGALHGFDLASAATSLFKGGTKGGETRFDQLSGHAVVAGHAYHLRGVQVSSGVLAAKANVDVSPAKQLSGRVDVDMKRSGGIVSVPLAVSGTVSDPMLLPTKGAMAGAVAGTLLLPGVGTAAGASVGDKIGKFFGK